MKVLLDLIALEPKSVSVQSCFLKFMSMSEFLSCIVIGVGREGVGRGWGQARPPPQKKMTGGGGG